MYLETAVGIYLVGMGTSVSPVSSTAGDRRTKATMGLSRKSSSPTSTLEASAPSGIFFMKCVSTWRDQQEVNRRIQERKLHPSSLLLHYQRCKNKIRLKISPGILHFTVEAHFCQYNVLSMNNELEFENDDTVSKIMRTFLICTKRKLSRPRCIPSHALETIPPKLVTKTICNPRLNETSWYPFGSAKCFLPHLLLMLLLICINNTKAVAHFENVSEYTCSYSLDTESSF